MQEVQTSTENAWMLRSQHISWMWPTVKPTLLKLNRSTEVYLGRITVLVNINKDEEEKQIHLGDNRSRKTKKEVMPESGTSPKPVLSPTPSPLTHSWSPKNLVRYFQAFVLLKITIYKPSENEMWKKSNTVRAECKLYQHTHTHWMQILSLFSSSLYLFKNIIFYIGTD